MGLIVINPGVLTTVQDAGRTGYMDSGFSSSGALDGFSSRLANFLVSNPAWEAVLEMTLCGGSFLFDSPGVVALTGADMQPLLNGKPVSMNKAFSVSHGDILYTTAAVHGVRTYMAAAGGFDIEPVLGSRSTNLNACLGGFKGRKLKTKDTIAFRWTTNAFPDMDKRVFDVEKYDRGAHLTRGTYSNSTEYTREQPLVLRVVQGKQASFFSQEGIDAFYNSIYTVQSDSDRMGVRLDGPAVASVKGTDIVSDGIPLGAIQIPGSGKPIILLNDRQTTGGYAKIGAVITGDLWLLSQAVSDSAVRFERISAHDAEKIYIKTEKEIQRLKTQFTDKDRLWSMQNCCLVM
jgi:biotin-dependent carboxylase-like uncharacterized protein